jgi:hypothetical protein
VKDNDKYMGDLTEKVGLIDFFSAMLGVSAIKTYKI